MMKLHFQLWKLYLHDLFKLEFFYYLQSLAPAYDVKMTIVIRDLDKEIYMDEYKKFIT
jgi:hypothetical protein